MEQVVADWGPDVPKTVMRKFGAMMEKANGQQKDYLWTMYGEISFGLVWGDDTGRRAAALPALDGPGRWWPCIMGQVGWGNLIGVLCEPLLENCCKKPWLTHPSRLRSFPAIAQPGPAERDSTVTIEELSESGDDV